ncbi:MAG: cytochrome C [Gammaproteobacteria bacterium]|nr:cytochrome C [Gammaproteobacteria bacterium]
MQNHLQICLLITTFTLSVMASISHATEISRGMMLSNPCTGCHGTDGKSPGDIPSIYGKSAAFIAASLRDFQSGSRPATVMGRHALGYSEEEITLIANYFSELQ